MIDARSERLCLLSSDLALLGDNISIRVSFIGSELSITDGGIILTAVLLLLDTIAY
jgi:hypothetical protein